MNNKKILIGLLILIILTAVGCKAEEQVDNGVVIDGRIIEVVAKDYILLRNEDDTNIYYEIDISDEPVFENNVNRELNPDNVISARVQMINEAALPKEAKLIIITANKAPDYMVTDAKEAKGMMEDGDVIILDVRTREEFENGYIPEAFNLPLTDVEKGIKNITENKDETILVYCRSGNRSKVAARILSEMGYGNVYDFGGIVNWPYDIEGN